MLVVALIALALAAWLLWPDDAPEADDGAAVQAVEPAPTPLRAAATSTAAPAPEPAAAPGAAAMQSEASPPDGPAEPPARAEPVEPPAEPEAIAPPTRAQAVIPVAPAPPPTAAELAGQTDATRRFAALRRVSVWDGNPLPSGSGIRASCNRHGDVELQRGEHKRTVICELFHTEPGRPRGHIRRKVCAPNLNRCVDLRTADLRTLPAYICTPKSGFAYGLRRIDDPRRAVYVSEDANAGDRADRPTRQAWKAWCGGPAPYVYWLEGLEKNN